MIKYTSNLTMKDLFQNDILKGVLPQMRKGVPLRNVYSFLEIETRVEQYLRGMFGGSIVEFGGERCVLIKTKYTKKQVMVQVKGLAKSIEDFFNNMPKVSAGLRRNLPVYMPFKSAIEIAKTSGSIKAKQMVMNSVLENFMYNPRFEFGYKAKPIDYIKKQDEWKKKVGFKE